MIALRSVPDLVRACRSAALAVGVVTCVPLVCPVAAAAATLTVTTTKDELAAHNGRCSLREAIEAVETPGARTGCGRVNRGSNTIVLGSGRYVLSIPPRREDDNSSGDLNVDGAASLTITGAGVRATVIDAGELGDRVLSVASGARLVLSRLSITGGRAPAGSAGASGGAGASCVAGGAGFDAGARGSGGGIFNGGILVLETVAVRGNRAGAGGAGGSGGGANCNGGDGGLGGSGGGVYNRGRLTLIHSTVSGNRAGAGGDGGSGDANPLRASGGGGSGGPGGGGGGLDNRGTLSVTASTVASNRAGAGGGGGPGGTSAGPRGAGGSGGVGASGGGIFSGAGLLTVLDSTLYDNIAGDGGGGGALTSTGGNGGDGGGIAVAGPSRVRNATVAGNGVGTGGARGSTAGNPGAAGVGGGLFVQSARGADDMQLQNTIVASSLGANCAGTTGSAIANVGRDLSYGDQTCPGRRGNPELGPLEDNGGPTATMAIRAGSAATDAFPARNGGCPARDQRDVRRPQGRLCDIGAYESAIPRITMIAPFQGASYERGSRIPARFRCDEGGVASTIATCTGSVVGGHAIGTGRLGTVPFVVTATDKNGTRTRMTVHYYVWVYLDPVREITGLTPRRIDLGVDYAGSGPLLAIGRAHVTMASDTDSGPSSCWAISCWPGGGIVVMRLLDGPFAGKYVYVAEHITVSVRAGQTVSAGQQIATLHGGYPWSEWGWAAGPGPEALAMADGHWCHTCADVGDWSTIEGRNMNTLLMRLGAPSGLFQPIPSQKMPPGWPTWLG
ncbi:MAG: choice-of-anchor Q domain-containing protein [Solirubrobacteraceae bacterium]